MVRVFRCHGFKSATVVPVTEEPLAVFCEGEMVFVATRQCTIKVLKRNDEGSGFFEWRAINTISMVEKIAYNKLKNYIITLEQKKSWKSVSRFVRIYLCWHLEPLHKSTKQRTKVRIAGKSHSLHSSKEYVPQLEVVELPLDGTVTALDVCRSTGNFALAFGKEVKLYHIVEKTVANSDKTYQDAELFLELSWNFEICSLSLCEEFLVCCSHKQVQGISINYAETDDGSPRPLNRVKSPLVFERSSSSRGEAVSPRLPRVTSSHEMFVNFEDISRSPEKEVTERYTSSPAFSLDHSVATSSGTQSSFSFGIGAPRAIVDDEHYEEWSFEPDDNIDYDAYDTMKGPSKIIYLNSLHRGSPHPQHGTTPPVLKDLRGGPVKSSSGVSAKTVLHLSDVKEQDDWLSVTLIPSDIQDQGLFPQSPLGWSGSNPVRSTSLQQRCSVCCYVSSGRGGYLYRLKPGVSLVSIYRYTDKAYKVVAGPHLLQVVTKTGLETYTARWGAIALAVTEGAEGEDEIRPSSSLDICLCGIEPFFGASDISHGDNIIALLTKLDAQKGQDDLLWNLYVLQNCSVHDLYKDMVNFACRILETGPASYLHLVQEAHLLLRWELRRSVVIDTDLQDLYLESCSLLGDFYSWPHQDDWHLCLPYYKKSRMTVSEVVRHAEQNRQCSNQETPVYLYGRGLMQFLDWALYELDDTLNLENEVSYTVLQIYAQTNPESVPSLLLLSKLQGYNPETALQMLSDLWMLKESRGEQMSSLDRLASVQVHLLSCDPSSAELELSSIDKAELLHVCSKYPKLIQRDAMEFTPLGQLMRRHIPDTLLHLLAEIVGQGDLSLDASLLLLERNCDVGRCRNHQVREFLEVLLTDVQRKIWFEETVTMLCEIYVQRLFLGLEMQPSKQKRTVPPKFQMPSGNGHFAARFSWLDYLPPVNSPCGLTNPCQKVSFGIPGMFGHRTASMPLAIHDRNGSSRMREGEEACTCAFCIQDLLKLQSLLCSKHTGPELRAHMLRLLESRQDMPGWDSLWMLCSHVEQTKEVTEFAVDKYPHILAKFAASTYGRDLEKWQLLLRCIEYRLKEQTHGSVSADNNMANDSLQQVLISAYKDVLEELVELFPAEEFLMSLPADGSLWFLLPFITRCLQRKHLEELKATITEKGKSLLSQLNAFS